MTARPAGRDLEDALVAVESPARRIDSSLWVERVLASELRSMRTYDIGHFLVPFLIFGAGFVLGVFMLKAVLS